MPLDVLVVTLVPARACARGTLREDHPEEEETERGKEEKEKKRFSE